MGYVKQVSAATAMLVGIGALLEHEAINRWLFSGLMDWMCIVFPIGVVIVSAIHLLRDEPKKETGENDWMRHFQANSFFPLPKDLSAQRIHRAKR